MVTLIIDDDEYSFHLNSKKKSILDQAIAEKLPVPFCLQRGKFVVPARRRFLTAKFLWRKTLPLLARR